MTSKRADRQAEPRAVIRAYVDESGTAATDEWFVLSAIAFKLQAEPDAIAFYDRLMDGVHGKHWRARPGNFELHANRLAEKHKKWCANMFAGWKTGCTASVVVRQADLHDGWDRDRAHMWTLGYLCERLSWIGRQHDADVHLTVAQYSDIGAASVHSALDEFEDHPNNMENDYLDRANIKVQPASQVPFLQLADVAAHCTWRAFTSRPDRDARPELIRGIAAVSLSRYDIADGDEPGLTKYGLKIHPVAARTCVETRSVMSMALPVVVRRAPAHDLCVLPGTTKAA